MHNKILRKKNLTEDSRRNLKNGKNQGFSRMQGNHAGSNLLVTLPWRNFLAVKS